MPTQSTIKRTDNEAEELRLSIYDDLINNLTIQIHAAKVNAVKHKATDKSQAVLFLRKARQLESQQEQLKRARDDPSHPEPPEFRREKRVTRKEINFPDIGPKAVRIRVDSIQELFPACGSACPTYLRCDFRFTESSAPITGSSGVVSCSSGGGGAGSPEYKHEFEIPIERTKLYAKYFERKKVTIGVYHKRPLLKDVQVARFEVPLAALLNKAEMALDCPVYCGAAKRPSATTVAKVVERIRVPLLGRDIVETVEEDLVITSPIFGAPQPPQQAPSPTASVSPAASSTPTVSPAASASASAAPTTPAADAPAQPQKTAATPAAKSDGGDDGDAAAAAVQPKKVAPAATQAKPAAAPAQTQAKQAPAAPAAAPAAAAQGQEGGALSQDQMDALKDECYDIKKYFSCELCDWEIARLQKEVAALRAAKKPTDEVEDRISAIEMQSQSLIVLVQTGKLTMEGYLENLNRLLANEKVLLKKLIQAKMVAEAKIVKARMAVLTAEIQSATEEE